jgi:hypothetical protein
MSSAGGAANSRWAFRPETCSNIVDPLQGSPKSSDARRRASRLASSGHAGARSRRPSAALAYPLNGVCRCDGRHTSQKKARKPPFASSKDRDRPDASPPPGRRDKRKALRRINPSAARPIAIKAQVPGSGAGAVFEVTVAVNSAASFRLKICPGAPRTRAPAVVASGIGVMQLLGKPRHEIERVSLNATSFFIWTRKGASVVAEYSDRRHAPAGSNVSGIELYAATP